VTPSPFAESPAPGVLFAPPVAESPAMRELLSTLEEVAPTPTTVLLLGLPGSGRSRLARYLHRRSGRSGRCLEIRCNGDGEALLAGIGSAVASAEDGTVILREVARLPGPVQGLLVRALEARPTDPARAARVVATAEPALAARAAAGAFRSDLFYRLNVFPLSVPSLKDRPEDLPGLAASILKEARVGAPGRSLADDALVALRTQLPASVADLALLLGGVREGTPGVIRAADFSRSGLDPVPPRFPAGLPLDLSQLERLAIEEALRRARGNRTHAARMLHIGLRTLRNKLRDWRAAGEEVPPPPRARQEPPASREPGADPTAGILARAWARRSQGRPA